MIIILDQQLFSPGVLELVRGLQFVMSAEDRRHALLMDPEWDAEDDNQPINVWSAKLPPPIGDAVRKCLERGLDEAANLRQTIMKIRVSEKRQSQWEDGVLSPLHALRLMQTPLWLVLENGRNDLQFLRRILDRKDRDELEEHLAEGRVEVPIGGGTGEIKMFLDRLTKLSGKGSSSREISGWIRRLRSWVMFDRDADPKDPRLPSPQSQSLRSLCASMTRPSPFPGRQLGRRTIENYLPFEALRLWAESVAKDKAERRKRVDAFVSPDFGDDRRACFAMKDGLRKDVTKAVREDLSRRGSKQVKLKIAGRWRTEKELASHFKRRARMRERWLEDEDLPAVFRGLSGEARRRLTHGFGDEIAQLYGDTETDDAWFLRVFKEDPAATKWREELMESLLAVI